MAQEPAYEEVVGPDRSSIEGCVFPCWFWELVGLCELARGVWQRDCVEAYIKEEFMSFAIFVCLL